MPSIVIPLRTAIAFALFAGASAHAADVTVQPAAGSGFVVKDASGTQTRLRVNENGEIVMPVLVNGVQKSVPICAGSDGAIGPCASNTGGGNAPAYTAATGLSLNGTTFSVAPTYQLPQSCAANQIAQWNGTAWACGSASGGGAAFALPYSGTINDAATAFGIGNDGSGSAIYGRSGPASGRFAVAGVWGDATNALGVWGSSLTNVGVWGESTGANGVVGKSDSGHGVYGGSNSGAGVLGESNLFDGLHGQTHGNGKAGVAGFADRAGGYGVLGGSEYGAGVRGVTNFHSEAGVEGIGQPGGSTGVRGTANEPDSVGVYGFSDHGYGMATNAPAYQDMNQPGWVKAMLQVLPVDASHKLNQRIARCFNSTLPRAQATTPPCGFNIVQDPDGNLIASTKINFGFNIAQRFVAATNRDIDCGAINLTQLGAGGDNFTRVTLFQRNGDWFGGCPFDLVIF